MLVDTANLKSSDVSLVMDRIFSSPTLLDRLYEQNLGFICGSKTNLSYCKSVLTNFEPLLRVGGLDTFLDEYSVQAKTASTTWTYRDPTTGHQERRSLFIHVYLDPFRAACERESLLRRLKAVEKKLLEKSALNDADRDLRNRFFNKGSLGWSYSPERWRENEKKFGLFILVSNTLRSRQRLSESIGKETSLKRTSITSKNAAQVDVCTVRKAPLKGRFLCCSSA